MRILVTGASGFVGQILVEHLRSKNLEVVAWGEHEAIDICDEPAVNSGIEASRPEAVIHLAAIAAPADARRKPREAWNVNVLGTHVLARAVLAHVPKARFVYAGSAECYGSSFNDADGPVTEDASLQPTTTYGATKAAADILIGQMAREGLCSIRMRPFNHTGPGQTPDYVASDFARQIADIEVRSNSGVLRVGNLDAQRDFMDVRDVVRAYRIAATSNSVPPGSAINIATGKPVSIRDLVACLIGLSTATIRIEVDRNRVRPLEIGRASGDPTRAKAMLGWVTEISLQQTLSDILNYWRARLRTDASP